MLNLVGQLKQTTQLKFNKVQSFRTKVPLYLEFNSYIIKTAESQEELLESFKIRHEVFRQEFCGDISPGIDIDRFDAQFDHLIIVHKASQEIIGTYRVSCSRYSSASYTGQEFQLQSLFEMNGPFLELGRACILPEHRRGAVITLLWRGIAQYMKLSDSQILFGCTSIKVNCPKEAALIYRYFEQNDLISQTLTCEPQEKYRMSGFIEKLSKTRYSLSSDETEEVKTLIPSLLFSYLRLGAKVASHPAFDKEFDCIDFLTVLNRSDMPNSLAHKFDVLRQSEA